MQVPTSRRITPENPRYMRAMKGHVSSAYASGTNKPCYEYQHEKRLQHDTMHMRPLRIRSTKRQNGHLHLQI